MATIKKSPQPNVCPDITNTSLTAVERLKVFDALWEENKDRIRMPKSINYPMNYKHGIRWASRHCDVESSRFAEMIIANTIYVSFGAFIASLQKICESFKKHYKDHVATFVLIVPFDMAKSNLWTSLLAYQWIKDMISDIDFDITSVYNRYLGNKSTIGRSTASPDIGSTASLSRSPVVCIICDDCAYTGNQLMSYCTLNPEILKYDGKPTEPPVSDHEWIKWNSTITTRAAEIEASIDKSAFCVALLIPYMSTHAQQNIANKPFMMAPRDVHIFRPFHERINIYEFNQGIIREFETTFQYHANISAIYFDHKVADAVSTFNKIYMLAPVFGCGNLRQSLCFIDGCCNSHKIPDDINIYDVYMNLEDILKDKTCPPTFYKSIKYTYNGQPIGHLCTYELFDRQDLRLKKHRVRK